MNHYGDPIVDDAVQFDFDDPDTWQSAQTLQATMQFVRRSITFHRDRTSWVRPPNFPFVLRLDSASTMITFSCANILTIDIDDVEKSLAVDQIEDFAERHDLTFRLFETDHGMHAYCTSKPFHWKDPSVRELMSEIESCDRLYIAFVAHRGFSWRISPKLFSKLGREKRVPLSKEEFSNSFVKRPWGSKARVGNAAEDPALWAVVKMAWHLSLFVQRLPALYERLNDLLRIDGVLQDAAQELVRMFAKRKHRLVQWMSLEGTHDVPYFNDIAKRDAWFPSREPKQRNLNTRHPLDGRLITVYRIRRGLWSWCHRQSFFELVRGGEYKSRKDAREAAIAHFAEDLREARVSGISPRTCCDDEECELATPAKKTQRPRARKNAEAASMSREPPRKKWKPGVLLGDGHAE
eukprot:TRINITY_DN17746_c0_g1_i1.p1 TRINITY_DN17746_c0_g1~~TRINITY_DN17746_c0_g1_i1.p1  ORF type:complete len:407 (+),score=40.03 TRINITY_DN17746_c0_g1_i1:98-1318(+)